MLQNIREITQLKYITTNNKILVVLSLNTELTAVVMKKRINPLLDPGNTFIQKLSVFLG